MALVTAAQVAMTNTRTAAGICVKWQSVLKRLSCTNNNGVIDSTRLNNNKTHVNYDEVKAWGVSFARLMQNAVGRSLLKQHLVQEHAEENLLFWESVEAFKELTNADELDELARDIYEQFVSSQAKTEVSVDSKCRIQLEKAIKQPNRRIFDEAQEQIFKLMERDNYPRFQRSKVYQNFLLQQVSKEEITGWGESLEKLLQSDEGRFLLEQYLVNEKAEENLRFWCEVQDYKKILNVKMRKSRAADIYNRFVNPEAKTEISIDGPSRTVIIKSYEKAEQNLFDAAEEHIFLLMRCDCYPRFVKSPIYKNFLDTHTNSEKGQLEEIEEDLS